MNRNSVILTVVFVFLFSSMLYGAHAEDRRFANRKLEALFCQLPISSVPGSDTIMFVPQVAEGKEIIFLFDDKQQLSHLGISLFSSEIKQMLEEKICNFIERFFLELLLQNDRKSVKFKLEEYDINLTFCGKEFGEGLFTSIHDVLYMMDADVDFTLRNYEDKADATWISDNYSLRLSFPMYRELIEGTDKKESDEEVFELLQVAVSEPVYVQQDHIMSEKPERLPNGVYVLKGESGLVEPLSSDCYYVLSDKGEYDVLYDEKYPEYSMNNLFLIPKYTDDKVLHVTHRQYGHFTPEISVSLSGFLACFQDDFKITSYTFENENHELETTVVLHNKTLNYIHILRARISEEELFRPSSVIYADFYSNIPQHYIKTLLR